MPVLVVVRTREGGIAYGGIILTASHNPGGLENDFGIKCVGKHGAHPTPAHTHYTPCTPHQHHVPHTSTQHTRHYPPCTAHQHTSHQHHGLHTIDPAPAHDTPAHGTPCTTHHALHTHPHSHSRRALRCFHAPTMAGVTQLVVCWLPCAGTTPRTAALRQSPSPTPSSSVQRYATPP